VRESVRKSIFCFCLEKTSLAAIIISYKHPRRWKSQRVLFFGIAIEAG